MPHKLNASMMFNIHDYLKIQGISRVSWNRCTPESSIPLGFPFINHPFEGIPPLGHHHVRISAEKKHNPFSRAGGRPRDFDIAEDPQVAKTSLGCCLKWCHFLYILRQRSISRAWSMGLRVAGRFIWNAPYWDYYIYIVCEAALL